MLPVEHMQMYVVKVYQAQSSSDTSDVFGRCPQAVDENNL